MYTIIKSRNILKNKYKKVKGSLKYNKLQLNNLIIECSKQTYINRRNEQYDKVL